MSQRDPRDPIYGDGEDFSWGGAMFRESMKHCDDCDAKAPLAWWGRDIRICASCAARRCEAPALHPTGRKT